MADNTAKPTPGKQKIRKVLFMAVPVAGIIVAVYLFIVSGRYESTDNAYIKADVVNFGADILGHIAQVYVKENQPVNAGDLLLSIDPKQYQVAVKNAEAKLQQAYLQVNALKSDYAEKASGMAAARDDLDFAVKQLRRAQDLFKRGMTSQQSLDQAQRDLDVARNTMKKLSGRQEETLAELGGDIDIDISAHPEVLAAKAALEQAKLNLERCELHAPISGIASKVPKPGGYAMPGFPVISIVSSENTWIEANFKEDQLEHIHPGAPAKIKIDAYPGKVWEAHVESIAQATGAEFSLLPPQNATGNWVKVVQRIPVRLVIENPEEKFPLRAGLSVHVDVALGASKKAKLASGPSSPENPAHGETNLASYR